MTDEEAVELGQRAIYHATFRDAMSGGINNGTQKPKRARILLCVLTFVFVVVGKCPQCTWSRRMAGTLWQLMMSRTCTTASRAPVPLLEPVQVQALVEELVLVQVHSACNVSMTS